MLVDHSKFNNVELSIFVELKDIDKIITDNPQREEIEDEFKEDFIV